MDPSVWPKACTTSHGIFLSRVKEKYIYFFMYVKILKIQIHYPIWNNFRGTSRCARTSNCRRSHDASMMQWRKTRTHTHSHIHKDSDWWAPTAEAEGVKRWNFTAGWSCTPCIIFNVPPFSSTAMTCNHQGHKHRNPSRSHVSWSITAHINICCSPFP